MSEAVHRSVPGWRPLSAAALVLALSGPVQAQSDDTLLLMNRLNDLETQVQQLKRAEGIAPQSSAGAYAMAPGTGGAGAADTDVRLGQIQDQIRNLTGELETQGNQIAQLRTESQRLNQDMQMRLNDLEGKVGSGSGAPTSLSGGGPYGGGSAQPVSESGSQGMYGPPAAPAQTGTLGTLVPGPDGSVPAGSASSPEKDYEAAYNQLGQGDYADSEAGFEAFLQRYPKNALAANAKYWLGESFFQRGMNDKAAVTFAESYKQYPNGPKAPDSLLRLGMSLGQEGKTQQACVAFAELGKQFPAAAPKVKAQLVQQRSRYACP